MFRLNLKAKFALLTGTLILAVALALTTFLTRQQERTIREELLNRAVALTANLAYNCQLPLAAENQPSLRRLAQGLFKQAEVSYVEFQSSTGKDLHHEGDVPDSTGSVRDERQHSGGTCTSWVTSAEGLTFLDVRAPVVVEATQEGDILATSRRTENVALGTVHVGFSTAPAQALIDHVHSLGVLLGLAVALAGSLVAALLIHFMTRPLEQLMEGNRRVARGDFGLRLEVSSGDEFARLAGSYNQMADEIQRSRELAESYLASLRANAEHLEEANRALQQSNAELAKANRMKSEFLAVMSHELRTPLNVIIGFSEVLLDRTYGAVNEKQAHYAENILTSGRHLLTLINDILDLSKVEAGRMKVAPEPFDLRPTLAEILSLVREIATKKGVEVRCAPVPTLTPVTDQKLLKQVMLNLLSNAIKFTPTGGHVDLTVRCLEGRMLRSDAATQPLPPERRLAIVPRRVLLVQLCDTGVGIAPEDHEKIFRAFQQVDASYARRQEGTGLGLALTRKLVHLLGGDIWFASVPGQGSTFWFYVPFEIHAEEAGSEDDQEVPAQGRDASAAHGAFTVRLPAAPARETEGSGLLGAAWTDWPWGNPTSASEATSAPAVTAARGVEAAPAMPSSATKSTASTAGKRSGPGTTKAKGSISPKAVDPAAAPALDASPGSTSSPVSTSSSVSTSGPASTSSPIGTSTPASTSSPADEEVE